MTMLYSEADYESIKNQLKKRQLLVCIPFLLCVGLILFLAIIRVNQIIVMALTILSAGALIFFEGLFIHPINCYRKHLDNVLHGKTHTVKGVFKEMEPDSVIRDGVYYYPLIVNVGTANDEKDDRLLYFDANLPRPEWQEGEYLSILAHDKAVGAWERSVREDI